MATEIKMPQLSDTMAAGKILAWRKNEGDKIERGDILAEVETDKANLEIEAFQKGILLKIIVAAGQTGKVGEAIAVLGEAGESVSAGQAGAPVAIAPPSPVTQQMAQYQNQKVPGSLVPGQSTTSAPRPQAPEAGRVRISPLARKLAEDRHVDLNQLRGSGPNGRIIRRDIEGRVATEPLLGRSPAVTQPASVSSADPLAVDSSGLDGQVVPYNKMRATIARRMQEAVTQSPHFFTTVTINMRQAKELREKLKGMPDYKGISINHLIIKAAGYGLAHEPRVNRSARGEAIYQPNHINIGIITALEDGLLIPVVRDANLIPLKDLVFEARAAVERAKAGRPTAADLNGGTFSISNMGMFDVENFTAIINPGQGAVLAVSSIRQEPVVENGQIVIGDRMKATLSVDHRVIDGVMAGNFLSHFKAALECPGLLLV